MLSCAGAASEGVVEDAREVVALRVEGAGDARESVRELETFFGVPVRPMRRRVIKLARDRAARDEDRRRN